MKSFFHFNSGLIIQWGQVTTDVGMTLFTMPIAVTTFFISVSETQDIDDYEICACVSGGYNYTQYYILAAYDKKSYTVLCHWHAVCI